MFGIPIMLILFLLGPFVLGAFVATLVVPIVYMAVRSKIKDPFEISEVQVMNDPAIPIIVMLFLLSPFILAAFVATLEIT
jgi:hypothetical protein